MNPLIEKTYQKPKQQRRENAVSCQMCQGKFPWSWYMADTMLERSHQPQGVWICPSTCPRKGELQAPAPQQPTAPQSNPQPVQGMQPGANTNDPFQMMRAAEAARSLGNIEEYRQLVRSASRALIG